MKNQGKLLKYLYFPNEELISFLTFYIHSFKTSDSKMRNHFPKKIHKTSIRSEVEWIIFNYTNVRRFFFIPPGIETDLILKKLKIRKTQFIEFSNNIILLKQFFYMK